MAIAVRSDSPRQISQKEPPRKTDKAKEVILQIIVRTPEAILCFSRIPATTASFCNIKTIANMIQTCTSFRAAFSDNAIWFRLGRTSGIALSPDCNTSYALVREAIDLAPRVKACLSVVCPSLNVEGLKYAELLSLVESNKDKLVPHIKLFVENNLYGCLDIIFQAKALTSEYKREAIIALIFSAIGYIRNNIHDTPKEVLYQRIIFHFESLLNKMGPKDLTAEDRGKIILAMFDPSKAYCKPESKEGPKVIETASSGTYLEFSSDHSVLYRRILNLLLSKGELSSEQSSLIFKHTSSRGWIKESMRVARYGLTEQSSSAIKNILVFLKAGFINPNLENTLICSIPLFETDFLSDDDKIEFLKHACKSNYSNFFKNMPRELKVALIQLATKEKELDIVKALE